MSTAAVTTAAVTSAAVTTAAVTTAGRPRSTGLSRLVPARLSGPGRRAAWRRAKLRRALSALLVALLVWLLAGRLLPPAPVHGVPVLVAARDLPVGAPLQASDVRLARWPPDIRPPAALTDPGSVVGRRLSAPVVTGEAVTTARLDGPGLLTAAAPGEVAAHVSLSDPAVAAMVRTGDIVDVLSSADGRVVAGGATVLALDGGAGGGAGLLGSGGSDPAAGVVVAVPTAAAAAMVRAAGSQSPGAGLTLTLRRSPP